MWHPILTLLQQPPQGPTEPAWASSTKPPFLSLPQLWEGSKNLQRGDTWKERGTGKAGAAAGHPGILSPRSTAEMWWLPQAGGKGAFYFF